MRLFRWAIAGLLFWPILLAMAILHAGQDERDHFTWEWKYVPGLVLAIVFALWYCGSTYGVEPLTQPESNQLLPGTYYVLEWTFDPVPDSVEYYVHYPTWTTFHGDCFDHCFSQDHRPWWLDKPEGIPDGIQWAGFGMSTGGLEIGHVDTFDFYWERPWPASDLTYSWEFEIVPETTWGAWIIGLLAWLPWRKRRHEEWPDREPYEETWPKLCPHGNEWHECNDCMVASDQAYDAWRESR